MGLMQFFIENYTNSMLKKFIDLCGGPRSLTRKADRARYLAQTLTDPQEVRRLWHAMDKLSQKALAAAYHNDGFFNQEVFYARYGALPKRPKSSSYLWSTEPILLDLFIHKFMGRARIHPLIMPLLADIVPPFEPFRLKGQEEPPKTVKVHDQEIELLRADREQAGLHDLTLYLTLLNQGKIKLSSSTGLPTPKSIETLTERLHQGDLFEEREKPQDAIIPIGLSMFCDGAELVTYKGNLTSLGKQYLATRDPELLLEAFETWVSKGRYDELHRLKAIKGQRARGVRLTRPGERREKIIEALSWSPTGVWISIFDFYRAIKIWELDFDLEEGGLDKLYVGYRQGTRDWYEPWASYEDAWMLTNGLYINLIIMEYLAAIGAVDIVYTYPDNGTFPAFPYYSDQIGFSRYDGLLFFRINPLGAFLFGQADAYTPSQAQEDTLFFITPEREIVLLKDELTPVEQAQLDQITEMRKGRRFLSRSKLLAILDNFPDLEIQRVFLEQHHRGPLPEEVKAWLTQVEENSKALRVVHKSLTIKVRSAELAQKILDDPKAGRIARRLDAKTLIIPASRETAFRNALREMGYGLK